MEQYRSYFLNAASRIIGMASFRSADVQAALTETRRQLVDHDYRVAAELWRDEHYIGCVMRSDPQTNEAVSVERLAKCPLLKKAS